MLKSILVVTLLVTSVPETERAWKESLGYRTVDRGQIGRPLAETWSAPDAAGRAFALMQPASGAEVYLRFVEAGGRGNYAPMKTLGWNAVEVQARDPDRLVGTLDPTRFELIGPPAYLTDKNNVRAAQVLGPDRELIYFTRVIDPARTTFRIGTASSWVDRVFIMVLGTGDMQATTAFWRDTLGQPVSGPWPYRVEILSRAWDRPAETLWELSIAQLEADFLVEMDAYPADTPPRTNTPAGLPFGPAVVAFQVDRLDLVEERTGRRARVLKVAPYHGREVLFVQGPSGARVALVGPAPGAKGER